MTEEERQARPRVDPRELLGDDDLLAVLEALLYAADDPTTPEEVAGVITQVLSAGGQEPAGEPDPAVLEEAFHELDRRYLEDGRCLQVMQVAGGFRLATRPRYDRWIRAMRQVERPTSLSLPALETLAIVAYRQPVTAAEIGAVRGVDASGVLGTLREQGLIRVTGRKKAVGRPFTYGTTGQFLMTFGLRDLDELPDPEEFEELLEG